MLKLIQKQSAEITKRKLNEFITKLDELNLDSITQEDYNRVVKNYALTNLTTELGNEIKKAKIDVNALRDTWLSTLNSETTARNYRHCFAEFTNWSGNRNPVDFKSVDADHYLIYLKNQKYSDGTIRFKIACVSSFFSFLTRHEILSRNCFERVKLPRRKIEIKSFSDVPVAEELNCIEQELLAGLQATGQGSSGKIKASKMLLAALYVMKETACRVGALPSIRLDPRGNFSARSKNSFIRGKISPDLIEKIKELGFDESAPFKDFKTATIKKYFEIICKRLYQQGNIRKVFSPHSIRHYAAVKHWKQNHDIYALKKFLNHQSISTSQIYLSSLNLEV